MSAGKEEGEVAGCPLPQKQVRIAKRGQDWESGSREHGPVQLRRSCFSGKEGMEESCGESSVVSELPPPFNSMLLVCPRSTPLRLG